MASVNSWREKGDQSTELHGGEFIEDAYVDWLVASRIVGLMQGGPK